MPLQRKDGTMTKISLMRTVAAAAAFAVLVGTVTTSSAQSLSANNPHNIGSGVAPQGTGGTNLGSTQMFAVVNSNGTRLRGKGDANSSRISTGTYDIRFARNITQCGWVGTIGLGTMSGSVGPSFISVTGRAGTTNGVFVQTWNSSGTLTDLPFIVYIDC